MRTAFSVAAIVIAGAAVALTGPSRPAYPHGEEAGFGVPGDPSKAAHVVRLTMRETTDGHMLFAPSDLTIRRGEQVRFIIENKGALDHELVIDTVRGNQQHAIEMQKNPDMQHDDPNAIRLAPTARGEILWRFTEAGTFDFSCLIPGHREAGMHGTVRVR